jgi:hypothetical protein
MLEEPLPGVLPAPVLCHKPDRPAGRLRRRVKPEELQSLHLKCLTVARKPGDRSLLRGRSPVWLVRRCSTASLTGPPGCSERRRSPTGFKTAAG